MISDEQMQRVKLEMMAASRQASERAAACERALEDYTYPRTEHERRQYSPAKRDRLLAEFQEADYLAESRAWISHLICKATKKVVF